jgi:hypothetical protein
MGIPDGAHTHHGHGHGSGGIGVALLVLAGTVLAVKLAAPAAAAVGELLRVILIAAGVLAGLAGGGLVAIVAVRGRRSLAGGTTRVSFPARAPRRPVRAATEPRAAIERPAEVHLHFHGVDAEDVAAIIRREADPG